jgi:hypothetical protein
VGEARGIAAFKSDSELTGCGEGKMAGIAPAVYSSYHDNLRPIYPHLWLRQLKIEWNDSEISISSSGINTSLFCCC